MASLGRLLLQRAHEPDRRQQKLIRDRVGRIGQLIRNDKQPEVKPKTRASMLKEMEAAIAASLPLVESKPTPQLLGWLEHTGEHYGKLVNAYRANNIVPPVSRPKS